MKLEVLESKQEVTNVVSHLQNGGKSAKCIHLPYFTIVKMEHTI